MAERDERQDEIEARAAEWVARLGDGRLDGAERRAFERWLGEDIRHAAAFEEARAAWALMDEVAADPGALRRESPIGEAPFRAPTARRRILRWPQGVALAASLLVAAVGITLWFGDPYLAMVADYRTEKAERRSLTLSDGSVVELGPSSAIALRFTAEERRVELLSGLAYFVAAPRRGEERRPFVVQAGAGTARALGTQFSVDRLTDSVEVVVVEHEVAVAVGLPDGTSTQVVLSSGQAVRYAEEGLAAVRTTNVEQALGWRRDRLFFDRVPLERVVGELDRYRRGRIVIGNAALASRRVSGVFDTRDPDAVLATIARELGAGMASAPFVTILY